MVRNSRLGQVSQREAKGRSLRHAQFDEYINSCFVCVFACLSVDIQKRYENADVDAKYSMRL